MTDAPRERRFVAEPFIGRLAGFDNGPRCPYILVTLKDPADDGYHTSRITIVPGEWPTLRSRIDRVMVALEKCAGWIETIDPADVVGSPCE